MKIDACAQNVLVFSTSKMSNIQGSTYPDYEWTNRKNKKNPEGVY